MAARGGCAAGSRRRGSAVRASDVSRLAFAASAHRLRRGVDVWNTEAQAHPHRRRARARTRGWPVSESGVNF
eukprot:1741782-Rhodomonas_salina.2